MSIMAEQTERASASGGLSLELTKYFDVAPERVFDAWLGEEWGKWLPPGGATGSVTTMDAKPGGSFAVAMTMPGNRDIGITGKYIDIDRPNKLVMTWTGSYDGRETLLTITFRAQNRGTLMTLRQEGFVEEAMQQGYVRGWDGSGGSFDKLANLL